MTPFKKPVLIAGGLIILVLALPLLFLAGPDIYFSLKIRSSLKSTPGVAKIENFFTYEQKAFATVRLESGDLLKLDNIRNDTFDVGATVRMVSYDEYMAICIVNGKPTSTGFDAKQLIKAIAESKGRNLELNTFADIVKQFEEVKTLIYSLPDEAASPQKLSIFTLQGSSSMNCFKKPAKLG